MESSEVTLLSSPATDFNLDSGCSTPYLSAPSSPTRIPNIFNSDSILVNQVYRKLPSLNEKQGMELEMERGADLGEEIDFAFDFGGKGDGYESVFAEELFDCGKIRPLRTELKAKPVKPEISSNINPKISHEHRSSSPPLSSRSTNGSGDDDKAPAPEKTTSRSLSVVNKTRSLWDMFPFATKYRKWKLKNLLFRSASEGRNDGVAVRSILRSNLKSNNSTTNTNSNRRKTEPVTADVVDIQNDAVGASSFRSNDGSISGSNRGRRRARSVSAHELHYTLNRAASKELSRRTFLPYKQGLLGCLGFGNPADVVARVGSMTRG